MGNVASIIIAVVFTTCCWIPSAPSTALGSDPPEDALVERVDLIELNHNYDEAGRFQFNQIIYYKWSLDHCRYNVCAWRLLKHDGQIPVRNWCCGGYDSVWHDGDVLRVVAAEHFRETWTQFDPEMKERRYLPKDKRPDLARASLPGKHRRR